MTDPEPDPHARTKAMADVLVVVLDGFTELVERVEQVEASTPALVVGDDPITLASINARLDRHRGELEDIKSRWNALMQYLRLQTGSNPTKPDTTSENYQ